MCGIAGLVGSVADPLALDRMLDSLEHRGPDGRGRLVLPGVSIGMVRLAVVDVEHGGQPKTSDCGRWSVLLNGEIYNHVELRRQLEAAGRRFRTRSDTEVVATALAHWGRDALGKLDGMFVIAAWDQRAERLLLARDRIGEKPLYLRRHDRGLSFASEVKGLAAHEPLGRYDRQALDAFLTYGFVPAPLATWEGVEKLEPATAIEVDRRGSSISRWRYWLPMPTASSSATTIADLEERLRSAVRRTLVSDVEIGILLSGGIDSSLTAWFASEASPGLRAFTVRFDDPSRDESTHAVAVGRELGLDVELLDVGPGAALDVVHDLPGIYDEPFADQSAIPTVLLCRAVSKRVKVALGGDGGDELFNGYVMYRQAARVRRLARFAPSRLLRELDPLSTSPSVPLGRIGNVAAMLDVGAEGALMNVRRLMPPAVRRLLLGYDPGQLPQQEWWSRGRASFVDGDGDRGVDLAFYLPDDILVKVDRASMSTGLEIRTPFLQPDLIEWALGLGPDTLGPAGSKALPRALAATRFGSRMAGRSKQGFSVPLPEWLRGPLAPLVEDVLSDTSVATAGLVSIRGVDLLRDRLRRGRDSAARPVWALLVLHLWDRHVRSA